MADIVMPRLSDTMEEGTILRWLKRDGEEVRRGEELVEIETDKATMSYESDQEGVLQTVAGEGDTLAVGVIIARVGGERTGADARPASASPSAGSGRGPATGGPAGVRAVDGAAADGGAHPAAPASGPQTGERTGAGGRIKASPLARRIAHERGVDLGTVTGTGPGGRITRADVQAAPGQGARPRAPEERDRAPTPSAAAPAAGPAGLATAKGTTSMVELSRTQQTIARRMAESKATIPHFTLQREVDAEECVRLRAELKRLSEPEHRREASGDARVPTYNDMVVKACALALREHPRANASYRDGRVQLHSRVNVGVAVATEPTTEAGGALVVPTVFDADEKSLGEVAREARALADRVRDGSITPPELSGATFTVSNLGMYGVSSFTAIINPPQAAILSVGSVEQRPAVRAAELTVRHTMTLTLACDHRILYGAEAARFLARVGELLEAPAALTL